MNKKILLLLVWVSLAVAGTSQRHSFAVRDGSFLLDGRPVEIHAGEMHFARVPRAYWRQRLSMMKAMGLNAVATYVFWNYQETAPGRWDFTSGNHNIRAFLEAARDAGLMVILRPGPYACAEWEYGGFPWWLQNVPGLEVRTDNRPFLDSVRRYFRELARQVADLQVTRGGPVIMVQVENEFGSYVAQRKDIPIGQHRAYLLAIRRLLREAGFEVPLFTADGSWLFREGSLPGVLPAANGEDDTTKLKQVVNAYHNGQGPYFVAEFYPGWLDHWGEPFQKVDASSVAAQTDKYLRAGVSFSYYMVHGGTNFGFMSGANYDREHPIQPDITSYDYDAPITEAGWPTPKYDSLRAVFRRYLRDSLPPVPPRPPSLELPPIRLTRAEPLFDLIRHIRPAVSDTPQTFESLGQGYGYVLYEKKCTTPLSGHLDIPGLRDYGIVYINGNKVATLNRMDSQFSCRVQNPAGGLLQILVENMGRINYGAAITANHKGITGPVRIEGVPLTGRWRMFRLPMSVMPRPVFPVSGGLADQPALYGGDFTLTRTADTFLDMRRWQKGIVFVNGHNLGRYWRIGPQQTLYLPGCWLKKGRNTIVVFEQQTAPPQPVVASLDHPVLDQLNSGQGNRQ